MLRSVGLRSQTEIVSHGPAPGLCGVDGGTAAELGPGTDRADLLLWPALRVCPESPRPAARSTDPRPPLVASSWGGISGTVGRIL